jgi:CheY-like chemotaxis protein
MATGCSSFGMGCYASSDIPLPHFRLEVQSPHSGLMPDVLTPTHVLVLEDDATDAILIRRAFSIGPCRAFVCRNTSEARAYFLGSGMYADRGLFPFPDLFITYLRLGEESGIQFPAWVRTFTPALNLSVVILSAAATPGDILAAQRLRATRVLIKPADPIALKDMLILASRELCPLIGRNASASEVREDFVEV